ncbi:MAG: hypothetical protein DRJ03_00010 [Chloroflexi bacterium]|nr:MAG: hypothetical protein DRJ03_00010 [Chloroflexota bacterium]
MVLKRRHLVKSITWRVCSTAVTVLIAIAVTRDVNVGLIIGPIDLVVKVVLYYWHEKQWSKTTWGIKNGN